MTCCVVQKFMMVCAVLKILLEGNTKLPTLPASCARESSRRLRRDPWGFHVEMSVSSHVMWLINPHTQGRAKQTPVAVSARAAHLRRSSRVGRHRQGWCLGHRPSGRRPRELLSPPLRLVVQVGRSSTAAAQSSQPATRAWRSPTRVRQALRPTPT